ncbi:DNA polymerase ligase N-terminal domain-containing protein [Flindersiella endophytica]
MPGKHAGEPRRLEDYQRKRSFDQTPEPRGDSEPDGEPGNRFVIQEHHARSLHWDFRLERFGVLVSWAVPRGLPETPEENRLAVHTEDHPMEYLTFEDEIPSGYGAGQVKIWDTGTYETEKFTDDKVIVHLHGERVRGKYALFRTNKDWLIHRMDPPEPGYTPLPEPFPPMFGSLSELPEDSDDDGAAWGYEVHWDGMRALAHCDHGRLRLYGRDLGDLSKLYPEVSGLAIELGGHRAVFDGTVVTFDPAGQPSFELLQRRMHLTSDAWIRKGRREIPVTYVVFDLLHLDGRSLLDVPYAERRRELEALELTGKHWQVPAMQVGEGGYLLEAGRQLGLPGIFAKRLDSSYLPGERDDAWRKVLSGHRQEFAIAGWLPGDPANGSNPDGIGALVIAYRESDGPDTGYRYAGLVENGWDADGERRLRETLTALPQCRNWLAEMPSTISANFVEADLVCEVTFEDWSADGTTQKPVYKGLRADKPPAEVVCEKVVGP